MATEFSLEILLAHDRWATSQLLAAAKSLTDAQLDQPFEIGSGTLRKTFLHIIETQRGWIEAVNGKSVEPRDDQASIDELISRHESAADAIGAAAHVAPLAGPCTASRRGRTISTSRAGVLTHVLTHGMHHRAQALNMLRHLGVNPLPPSSVMQWLIATGSAQLS